MQVNEAIKLGKLNFWRENINDSFKGIIMKEPLSIIITDELNKIPIPQKPF